MKQLTIIQHDDGKFVLLPEPELTALEVSGMIYQAELLHRLSFIENNTRKYVMPEDGPATVVYPPSWCNCGTTSDDHGRLCNITIARHKRPIEPDTTGEAETAVKGTAKLKTESNGENDQKS